MRESDHNAPEGVPDRPERPTTPNALDLLTLREHAFQHLKRTMENARLSAKMRCRAATMILQNTRTHPPPRNAA